MPDMTVFEFSDGPLAGKITIPLEGTEFVWETDEVLTDVKEPLRRYVYDLTQGIRAPVKQETITRTVQEREAIKLSEK
jgi:hypothetical protein